MKKMKLFAAIAMMAMVATAGYFGYTAYKQANMTDAERMMLSNLEALTHGEVLMEACDTHCSYRCGYICILTTSVGYNINCDNMVPWNFE